MSEPHWWLNLGSFLGILILAVPVWSLNARKKRLQQIRDADTETTSSEDFRGQVRTILLDRHRRNVEDWRRRDEVCLAIGYALLLGSAALRLLFPSP